MSILFKGYKVPTESGSLSLSLSAWQNMSRRCSKLQRVLQGVLPNIYNYLPQAVIPNIYNRLTDAAIMHSIASDRDLLEC